MNGYELTRRWFDFAFENKDAKVQHTALFHWIVELNNRLGWKEEFGLSTNSTMEGLSIGNKSTYLSTLNDLQTWGFIKIVKPSKNQYQSCIITICRYEKATALHTALDTALSQHDTRQSNSIDTSTVPIDKQINIETIKQLYADKFISVAQLKKLSEELALFYSEITEGEKIPFESFWDLYPIKVAKQKCKDKWDKLPLKDQQAILEKLPAYLKYKPFQDYRHPNPETFFNQRRWEDEIKEPPPVKKEVPLVPEYTAADLFQVPRNKFTPYD